MRVYENVYTNLTKPELTEPLSKIPHLSLRAKMISKKLNYSIPSLWHDKDEAWQEAIPKVHRRVLANSQVASLALFRLDAGAVIPTHTHPHAQHGVCLEGTGEFTIGDQTWKISKGDSWFIPPGLPHEYRNDPKTPSLLLEVFTPQREEYPPDVPPT